MILNKSYFFFEILAVDAAKDDILPDKKKSDILN